MTDLELYKHTDDWVAMVEPIVDLANKLAQTPFAGAMRGKPADVFACILYGRELGLSPLQSLQLINVIQGRPTLGSEGLRALYLGQGHRIWPVEWTDRMCAVHAERGDGRGAVDITYTIKEAEQSGLLKNAAWRHFPKQMLLARATAMAIKAIAPDVALGLEAADSPMPSDSAPIPQGSTTVVQLQPQEAPIQATEPDPAPEAQNDQETPQNPVNALLEEIEAEANSDMVTPKQMRKIQAQLTDIERLEGDKLGRDGRRNLIAGLLGLDRLDSAKDLTAEQAGQAIEALDALARTMLKLGEESEATAT